MAVNVKMGVDLSGFTSGIKEGQSILKGLAAEMKAIEAEFNKTGNAEKKLADQTKNLTSQINVQKGIADQAAKALKTMADAGISPADQAYQKMFLTLQNATAGMNSAQAELNALGEGTRQAADGANELDQSLQNISKKISLKQVIDGIDRITDGMERAAKKAVELGQDLWDNIMDSAKWANDVQKQAQMYDMTAERYQQIQKMLNESADTFLSSQQTLNKGIGKGSKEFMSQLKDLGLAITVYKGNLEDYTTSPVTRDANDMFFRAGQAILKLGDAYKQEAAAQTLFGKSWRELKPIFEQYKTIDEFNAALAEISTVSEEDVEAGNKLYDTINDLKGNFETLKNDVLLQLAPALTQAADSLNNVLTTILKYLETEDGQKLLKSLGDAVSGLFDDLKNIDPESVVQNFVTVFDKLTSGLQWITDHSGEIGTALLGALGVFGTLKVSQDVLTVINFLNGLKGLTGGGAASGVSGAAAAGSGTAAKAVEGYITSETKAFMSEALAAMSSWMSVNGMSVWDWLTNESPFAGVINGTETLGDLWNRYFGKEAINDFTENWNPNSEDANFLMKNAKNNILYWDKIRQQQELASEWTFGDEYTADELMAMVNNGEPVPIHTDLEVDTSAEDIAGEIGTVTVPVALSFSGAGDIAGALISGALKGLGFANGLPNVPYDGLYKLHKGEQVVPARQVESRSFSSNLYVENMNMSGGVSADALAASIASRNRRMMAGYGS